MPSVVPITHRRFFHYRSVLDATRLEAILQPGDIIFGMALDAGATQLIRGYQARWGYPERAASATHVAIWTDAGTLLHSMAGRGCVEEAASYLVGRTIAIGRWDHPNKSVNVDAILAVARASLGRPYEMGSLFNQSLKNQPGWDEPFICSTFVNSAFRTVMRQASPLHHGGLERKTPYVCPAHLFIQPGLSDP